MSYRYILKIKFHSVYKSEYLYTKIVLCYIDNVKYFCNIITQKITIVIHF